MTPFDTAESMTQGHPDKVCDLIADRILDVCLSHDPFTRAACEGMLTGGTFLVAGELISEYDPDIKGIVLSVLEQVGYHPKNFTVQNLLKRQTLNRDTEDQGIVMGYACEESPEFLPLSVVLAHRLTSTFSKMRTCGVLSGFSPNARAQVTVEYDEDGQALRLERVMFSAQYTPGISEDEACWLLSDRVLYPALQTLAPDDDTQIQTPLCEGLAPKGVGMTGRQTASDMYGSIVPHGSGALSGKGPEYLNRLGAYMARYIAKNIVAVGLARRCQVMLGYAVGVREPVLVQVDTFGTGKVCADDCLADAIPLVFPLSPAEIIPRFSLHTPRYSQTAVYGHFGKPGLPWEKIDKAKEMRAAVI